MKFFLSFFVALLWASARCEAKPAIEPVSNATLPSFPFQDTLRLRDMGYAITRMLIDLPGNIQRYMDETRRMTEVIKTDFVGFIQANLAIPYGLYNWVYWEYILNNPESTKDIEFIASLIVCPMAKAVDISGQVIWDRDVPRIAGVCFDAIKDFTAGVADALTDGGLGYVIRIVKKFLNRPPFHDVAYLFVLIDEQFKRLKCNDVFTEWECSIPQYQHHLRHWIHEFQGQFCCPLPPGCRTKRVVERVKMTFKFLKELSDSFRSHSNHYFGDGVLEDFVHRITAKFYEFRINEFDMRNRAKLNCTLRTELTIRSKPGQSCDHYTPESVPSLCRIIQRKVHFMTDFPKMVQLVVNTLTKISVTFMKTFIDDFPGLVKRMVSLPWSCLRYTEVVRSVITSVKVERFVVKWFRMVKFFTMLPAMDQVRKIFEVYAILHYNLFTGINAGLTDSGLQDLIPLVDKFQISTVEPFVRTLEMKFQTTKCEDVFPESFCRVEEHRERMQEMWDFLQYGEFAKLGRQAIQYISEGWYMLSLDYVIPHFLHFCTAGGDRHDYGDYCFSYALSMGKVSQDGARELENIVEWLMNSIWFLNI